MSSKDYYRVLEVSPSASTSDIKKSYRRLAHKYHPDKNAGNKLFEAKFREIQEAYRTLSDDKKRQDYNYKRFDQLHGLNKKNTEPPVTAGMILQRSKELKKHVAHMDPDRMNRDAIYLQLERLFTPHNISLIQAHKDDKLSAEIVENILAASKHLDYNSSKKVSKLLLSIAGTNNEAYQNINEFLKAQQLRTFWQRYQLLLAMIVAVIFCLFIYLISTR